jgi:hypothetical protein
VRDGGKHCSRGRRGGLQHFDGAAQSERSQEHRIPIGSAQIGRRLGDNLLRLGRGRARGWRRRRAQSLTCRHGGLWELGGHGDDSGSSGAATSCWRRQTTPLHTVWSSEGWPDLVAAAREVAGGGDQARGATDSPLHAMVEEVACSPCQSHSMSAQPRHPPSSRSWADIMHHSSLPAAVPQRPSPRCCEESNINNSLDSLFQSQVPLMRMELLQLVDVHVEKASRPLREEVTSLKLLLARVGDSELTGGLGLAPCRLRFRLTRLWLRKNIFTALSLLVAVPASHHSLMW